MKRIIIIVLIVAALAVGGYYGYQAWSTAQTAAAAGQYQTVTVERGDLTASVGGTGTVRSNQSAVLAWQTSGNIEKLNAAVGDSVRGGQVLATLKESSLPQSVILARADLVTAKRSLADLTSSDVARATAYQALTLAQKELTDANTQRLSKQYVRGSQSTIEINEADLILAKEEFDAAEENYNLFAERDENDVMRANALSRLAAARRALERAQANLNYVQTMPNDNEIAQADARIQVAEARLKDAQREWDRIKEGPDAGDIAAAEARIKAIEVTLGLVDLEAPFNGTITEVLGKVGDQVQPGAIAYRLDDLGRLLVDVQITEVDINRIQPGQPVTLSFDAIQSIEYSGVVVEVGRVGTALQGVVNFNITIELTDPDAQVRPGMTAAITIATDQLPGVLLVPNRAVRLREGKYIVYLLQDGVPTAANITLGLTSDQYSEVLEGLKEGDTLVLNPPAEFQAGPPAGGGGMRGGTN